MTLKKYWCLFCGKNGPRWNTTAELFNHMKTVIHRGDKGNLLIYTGKSVEE